MEILDFSKGQVWGIVPEHFETVARKFFELNIKADDKKLLQFSQTAGDEKPYKVTDGGAAVIPISGPLSKRQSFISWLMGGSTYAEIAQMFKAAVADEDVNSIILDIDSPGGVVSGTEGVGDLIFNSRGEKPIVAYVNGDMASAAYWIGSAADVIVAQKTSSVGSIGVLMIHRDYSEMDKKEGIKTTYITAGKYKALGNPDQPLSKGAKEYFQQEVDYIYSIFIETVARNRDVGTDKVLSDMADGQVFIGERAKGVGLVDHIGNFDAAEQMAASLISNETYYVKEKTMKDENKIETIDQLTAAFPELINQVQDKAVEAARGKIENDSAMAERGRVLEIISVQFDEEQAAKLKSVIESGVSAEQFKAIKDLEPKAKAGGESDEDAEFKDKMLKNLEGSGAGDPGAGDAGEAPKDYMVLVEEYMAQYSIPRLAAMTRVNQDHPKAREEFIKKNNPKMANAG